MTARAPICDLRLGEVQAMALGFALAGGPSPGDADDMLRHFRTLVCLGVQDPEELLCVGTFRLRCEERIEVESALAVIAEATNLLDDEIEHHLGRGSHAEGRQHAREEMRALTGLSSRLLTAARRTTT